MARTVTATEANQRFSRMLRDVAQGESFTVTSRGRPVARLVPIERESQKRSIKELLDKLSARPFRSAGNWTRDDLYE